MTVAVPNPQCAAAFVEDILVCPLCKAALGFSPSMLRCIGCGTAFPQSRSDCYELLPPQKDDDEPSWRARQESMETWYREMVSTDWAPACFDNDYGPLHPLLSRYRGTILDLGGGAGITTRYLDRDTHYISVDPSLMWLGEEWMPFSGAPSVEPRAFVRGTGEALPIASRSVDVVLALWSINHVDSPETIFDEVWRVLRPGGYFLVVPEDVEPRWSDLPARLRSRHGWRGLARDVKAKLLATLPGGQWPLQPDHIRISEADLRRWPGKRFTLKRREWIGDYLTVEYTKRQDREG
jgi:SAM-dependent methyltransferase